MFNLKSLLSPYSLLSISQLVFVKPNIQKSSKMSSSISSTGAGALQNHTFTATNIASPPTVSFTAVSPITPTSKKLVPYPDSSDEEGFEDTEFLDRICSAIRHTASLKHTPMIHTYFTIRPDCNIAATKILHRAHTAGHVQLIRSSSVPSGEQVYSVGVPLAPSGRYFPSGIDPQWWVGKSRAEIKAGPFATKKQVRVVEGRLKYWQKKGKGKMRRLKAEEEKLRIGLRIQRRSEAEKN